MGKIIGIDLGTTNSCVAVFEGNEPVVIGRAKNTGKWALTPPKQTRRPKLRRLRTKLPRRASGTAAIRSRRRAETDARDALIADRKSTGFDPA